MTADICPDPGKPQRLAATPLHTSSHSRSHIHLNILNHISDRGCRFKRVRLTSELRSAGFKVLKFAVFRLSHPTLQSTLYKTKQLCALADWSTRHRCRRWLARGWPLVATASNRRSMRWSFGTAFRLVAVSHRFPDRDSSLNPSNIYSFICNVDPYNPNPNHRLNGTYWHGTTRK